MSRTARLPGIPWHQPLAYFRFVPHALSPHLLLAGVDLLNISLDTLQPHKFEIITRRRGHQRVLDAIDAAIDMGYSPVKVPGCAL